MREETSSFKISFCAISVALSVMNMFMSVIPSLNYISPAMSGIMIWIVYDKINLRWAVLSYLAACAVVIIIVPNWESVILFAVFFGYYTLLKDITEAKVHGAVGLIVKLLVFNVSVTFSYYIMIKFLGMIDFIERDNTIGKYSVLLTWCIGNIAFLLYDKALTGVFLAYRKLLKPRLRF